MTIISKTSSGRRSIVAEVFSFFGKKENADFSGIKGGLRNEHKTGFYKEQKSLLKQKTFQSPLSVTAMGLRQMAVRGVSEEVGKLDENKSTKSSDRRRHIDEKSGNAKDLEMKG